MRVMFKQIIAMLLATLLCQCGMAYANVYQPDLKAFPAPFMERVVILMPKGLTGNTLNALYYLTNALYMKKSTQSISIASHTYDSRLMTNDNTVVIGTSKEVTKLIPSDALPLKMNQDGQLLGEDGKALDNKTGVLMLIPAPWNNSLAVLIISGNSAESVATAANALRDKHFMNIVTHQQYATISGDSIQAHAEESLKTKTFNQFYEMSHDVKLMLPLKHTFTDEEIINLIINMAYNASNISNIDIVDNAVDISTINKSVNIIYLGHIKDNAQLNTVADKLPFNLGEHRLIINRRLIKLVNIISELPVGIVQVIQAPLRREQFILLITSDSYNNYIKTIETYFNANKRLYLRGDAELVYADGLFTSLDTDRVVHKAANKQLISTIHSSVINGFYTLLAMSFIMLVLLLIYQRAKKYFGRNPGEREKA